MIGPARVAAFQTLEAVSAGTSDLASALEAARARLADERDRALATEIAVGTLRWQRRLDYAIAHVAGRATEDIDPRVLTVLRLSAYQLLYLDRVPAPAVVDDAVDLARMATRARAAGFVNAVLRGLLRQRMRMPWPSRPAPIHPIQFGDASNAEALVTFLGITYSHPDWLVERWLERYGAEATERWLAFDNERPLVTLRINSTRTSQDAVAEELARSDISTKPTTWAPHGLVLSGPVPSLAALAGRALVQDEASQLVALAVGARPGECVLDLCAAPGGKATAVAEALASVLTDALTGAPHDDGLLVACDVRRRRVDLLARTLRGWTTARTYVCHVGISGPLPFAACFDRVLVDAPCSGLGTLRRDPDIRWRRSAADLANFARQQRDLLDRAAAVVRPGGALVYATCSSEPEENDDVVRAFLDAHPDFRHQRLDAAATPDQSALVGVSDAGGFLRTLPFVHGLEAFFAAVLVRETVQYPPVPLDQIGTLSS